MAKTKWEGSYDGNSWYEFLEDHFELASIDESAPYEVDETHILYDEDTGEFLLASASGCSCWPDRGGFSVERFAEFQDLAVSLFADAETREFASTASGSELLIYEAQLALLNMDGDE